ncbi:hypothetical protein [Amycolatopsis suaedae]|uniref:hypothetical protein n=1 Tax=Amycolatopsis suaedae TaxID=2510978 RepID=UPI0030B85F69
MIPTLTAGTRLFELVPLLESDRRVQVLFTVPETTDTWHGLDTYVRAQGGLVLPWHQAARHEYDLVLAASHRHLEQLRGPILLVPHGAGAMKSLRFSRKAGAPTLPATGLDRELLTYRGRLLPAALAVSTDSEYDALRTLCPEALPVALVSGDMCLDRMMASRDRRSEYRRALGVEGGQRLVTVSSTWSVDSAFGRLPGLCRALLDALPAPDSAVAAVLHPNIWTVHGHRQVLTWLGDCVAEGLRLIPPDRGWQATVLASDWVVGDHGSTTAYAAATGVPVTLATRSPDVRQGSIADVVAGLAPCLDLSRPLAVQAEEAEAVSGELAAATSAAITSRPGQAADILGRAMYRLLRLSPPEAWSAPHPVPAPVPVTPVVS